LDTYPPLQKLLTTLKTSISKHLTLKRSSAKAISKYIPVQKCEKVKKCEKVQKYEKVQKCEKVKKCEKVPKKLTNIVNSPGG
jgi:hypothetical protein